MHTRVENIPTHKQALYFSPIVILWAQQILYRHSHVVSLQGLY